MKRRFIPRFISVLVVGLISFSAIVPTPAQELPSRRISEAASARDVWTEMVRSSLTFEPIEFQISPTAGAVSFGGEKEGGDSLITRIMSPSNEDFMIIVNSMSRKNQATFLSTLMNGIARGRLAVHAPIIDANGNVVPGPSKPEIRRYGTLTLPELRQAFTRWIAETHDRPFAFLQPWVRADIFDGKFSGMSNKGWIDRAMKAYPRFYDPSRSSDPVPTHFNNWKPIFGDAEKYISRMVTELLGDWELNFRPQTTYGDFEKMMHWFRMTLFDPIDGKYNAFGHQWVVLPVRDAHWATTKNIIGNKLPEVYKAAQALITLRGIKMQSGILTSMYNEVRSDEMLRSHETERSVMRLKNNLFPSNTGARALNIEQRSGTSYNPTRRLVQQAIVSRYASNDWSGLADSKDYVLIPADVSKITENLTERFGVSPFEAKRALERIESVKFEGDEEEVQGLRKTSLAPFWNWENAPYISTIKQEFIKRVTRNFIQQLAALPQNADSEEAILEEFAKWATIADIDTDIENYLRPKPILRVGTHLGEFHGAQPANRLDVNTLDFGIEYTTRFPIRAASMFTEEETKLGKKAFLQIEYDLTPDEKRRIIFEIAERLAFKLHRKKIEPVRIDSAGHGHKIAITYEIPHPNGGTWRVEWDGIGRDYDINGNIITGSERGGVVEIVTPKMNPSQEDVSKLYEVFNDMGISPSFYSGGGHINFDLATFAGRPRQMARFIALFLEYRDVITAMFQHPGRFTTAEPHVVSQAFIDRLKNWQGSEEELKQFLYNERFFNTRIGRKTKYVQLELSSYFQDVIPEEFISQDFDIKNDYWRKQFRVDPKIRKGEFRLFGAPRTLVEADVQVRLVRSLINKALNDDGPIDGKLAPIDVDYMVNHSLDSFKRFEIMMRDLQLDPKEYEGFFAEGLQNMQHYVDSAFYEPYEKKMQRFPRSDGWKTAVTARDPEAGIRSKGRAWPQSIPENEAVKLKALRDHAKRMAARERKRIGIAKALALTQNWRQYDDSTVAQIRRMHWKKMMNYPEVALDYVYEKHILINRDPETASRLVDELGVHLDESATPENPKTRRLADIIIEMLEHPKDEIDFDRKLFYVFSLPHGRFAAYGASMILKGATTAELERFKEAMGKMPFQYQLQMVTSVDLRRTLYGVRGSEYETGWGDLFAAVMGHAQNRVQRKELIMELHFMIRQNDISLGKEERSIVLALHKAVKKDESNDPPRPPSLGRGEEEEDFASLLRRRCTLLLLQNSYQ